MNKILEPLYNYTHTIHRLLGSIKKGLDQVELLDRFMIEISNIEDKCRSLNNAVPDTPTHDLLLSFSNIASITKQDIPNIRAHADIASSETHTAFKELLNTADNLQNQVKATEQAILQQNIESLKEELNNTKKHLMETSIEHNDNITKTTKAISTAQNHLAEIENQITTLRQVAEREIEKITTHFDGSREHLNAKTREIDELVSGTATRVIADDYHKSAADEKKSADIFRLITISFMLAIVIIIIETTFTTLNSEFDWQKTLTRITLIFLLSVPTAYLARESAKHREQQYHFHQTSLDTRAISPFIASLPDEDQHKIKATVAAKLFAGRDFSRVGSDPFPLNTQEIIIELIKKLELPGKEPQK